MNLRLPPQLRRRLIDAILTGTTPAVTATIGEVSMSAVLSGDVVRIVGRVGRHPDAADLAAAPRYLLDAIHPGDAEAIRLARRIRVLTLNPRVVREIALA